MNLSTKPTASQRRTRLAVAVSAALVSVAFVFASPAAAQDTQDGPCYVTCQTTTTTGGGGGETTTTGGGGGETTTTEGSQVGAGEEDEAGSAGGGTLPLTGGDVLGLTAIGAAALGAGALLVVLSRRRNGLAEA